MITKKYFTTERWVEVLRKTAGRGGVISFAALSKTTGLKGFTLRKAILRAEEKGFLNRVSVGLYLNRFGNTNLEELSMAVGKPCYISYESALSHYNITSQMALVVTCVTTGKTSRKSTPLGEIVLRHIGRRLFWGYREEKCVLWAEPEKALLDWLYWFKKTKGRFPDTDELELTGVNRKKLRKYALSFPGNLQKLVETFPG